MKVGERESLEEERKKDPDIQIILERARKRERERERDIQIILEGVLCLKAC